MYPRRTLHLFAGAGGGILADLVLGHRPVCAVDIDPYCQRVLMQRQADGSLPWFPIFGDIRTFDGRSWRGGVDLVAAGFPCQPWSVAGQRRGAADERNLWPDTLRVVCEVGPRYVFLENAPTLLTDAYFGTLLGGLADAGYDAQWCVLGADDVGAPHRRKRLWILAHTAQQSQRKPADKAHAVTTCWKAWDESRYGGAHVAHAHGRQRQRAPDTLCPGRHAVEPSRNGVADAHHQHGDLGRSAPGPVVGERSSSPRLSVGGAGRRAVASDMGGGIDGLAMWLDRLRAGDAWGDAWEDGIPRTAPSIPGETTHRLVALGNGQVPLCAALAWQMLWRRSQEP